MRLRSAVLLMALVAIVIATIIASILAVRPVALPKPSRGAAVVAECPASGSDAYFSPGPSQADSSSSLSGFLRAADAVPLWCGDRMDTSYRFTLVFEWGKTKVVSIRRSSARWLLDGVE